MNLDTLLEQADAMLDSAMVRETDTGGTIETSSHNPSSLTTKPIKRELKPL
jgi:ABC-type transport system involved in cytochrome c biogenesis ATPase subunit